MSTSPVDRAPCDTSAPLRLGLLVSRAGATLQALIDACQQNAFAASVELVLSNHKESPLLERARGQGLTTRVLSEDAFDSADAYETALVEALQNRDVELVCLAGFSPTLGTKLVQAFPQRVLRMHSSLLPAFAGETPLSDALAAGVRVTGCTLHFLDENCGVGCILLQSALRVWSDDDEESLGIRISVLQQKAFVAGVRLIAEGQVRVGDGRTQITGVPNTDQVLEWYPAAAAAS
ncbi:MAG: phosphoribosylglycinamide formyltransferase [Pseudomonadota bacterium]